MLLGDETTKIFINTKGTIDDIDAEMKEFLAYIEDTSDSFANTASDWIKQIHKRVLEVKQSKEMEVEYMTLLLREREMKEEGIDKMATLVDILVAEGRIEDVKRIAKDKDYREELFEEYDID
jgi:hypothetical protein